MRKLNPEFYMDDLRLFKIRKSKQTGLEAFHLTGLYYFAVFMLRSLDQNVYNLPYRTEIDFKRACQLYVSAPTGADLSAVELTLRSLNTTHEIMPNPKYKGWANISVYFKKNKDINDLCLILLQSRNIFGRIMNKLTVNPKKMQDIVRSEFEHSDKIPPFEYFYYKLIDLLL